MHVTDRERKLFESYHVFDVICRKILINSLKLPSKMDQLKI